MSESTGSAQPAGGATNAQPPRQELSALRRQTYEMGKRNEVLSKTLRAARDELAMLQNELQRLTEPPNNWATIIALAPAGAPSRAAGEVTKDEEDHGPRVDVWYSGRMMRLAVSPRVPERDLQPGRLARLSEGLIVIDVGGFGDEGTVMSVKELLGRERVLLGGPGEDEKVYTLAAPLRDVRLRPGDSLLCDTRNHMAFERIEKPEVQSLMLEVVPDISYSDIGGLEPQIAMIQDAVEMPFVHPELFREHGLKPPKGILLYGPPGCGKTLIAKAVAHSLADRTREEGQSIQTSYFLNIKGPELLDKYVGETERQLRQIFARAREKASDGSPVVVFFDEMDSLFRTRGTGVSSDVETTIVPQLLSEIDGVERLDNVIVIGASNREDMIDPAILRPGRLDVKIRIERPDRTGAFDIFSKYLTPDLPIHAAEIEKAGTAEGAVRDLIRVAVDRLYSRADANRYLEITYADGSHETLYFGDFASGAMIQNIVDRAKKDAIKSFLSTGERGIRAEHLVAACAEEFHEHEDLPNTSNPDEWARISGRKGERVTHISVIRPERAGAAETSVETVSPAEGLL